MAVLHVTPELLASKAADVRKRKAEHEQIWQGLMQAILELSEMWTSQEKDAFMAKRHEAEHAIEQFSQLLEGYARRADDAATELQNVTKQIKSIVHKFE